MWKSTSTQRPATTVFVAPQLAPAPLKVMVSANGLTPRVASTGVTMADVNGDGLLQFAEIRFGADLIMLATPELGGLPYVVSGLVAAGGLAAALSTADGLLLTISNALVRDLYFQESRRRRPPSSA